MGAGKERATSAHAPVIGAEAFLVALLWGFTAVHPCEDTFFLVGNSEIPITAQVCTSREAFRVSTDVAGTMELVNL